jgi:Niemann-Pick C1 protein
MWLALIVSGALHGLVLLPVLLSLQGSQGWSLESEDESWLKENIAVSYESRPFLNQTGDDSDASDVDIP